MNTLPPAVKLGAVIACLHNGFSVEDFFTMQHVDRALSNPEAPGYGMVEKLACKIAANAYAECGRMHHMAYHVYDQISKCASWNPDLQAFAEAVFVGLAKNAQFEKAKLDQPVDVNAVIKSGAALGSLAGTIGRVGTAITPATLRTMLAASAATGAGGGALWWLANRHVREDDNEAEATRQKIDYYKGLTGDISSELKARGLLDESAQSNRPA